MRIAYASMLPRNSDDPKRFIRPPLAVGYLSAYAEAHRGNRDVHDIVEPGELDQLKDIDAVVSRLLSQDPFLLALSVYVWNHAETSEVCQKVRSASPHVRIVVGGPEVAYTPMDAIKRFDCDWICTGEGEIPFLNLLNSLDRSLCFSGSVPGLLSTNDRKLDLARVGPLVKSLDDIPSPYMSRQIKLSHDGWVDLETTRGCPYACRFCLYGKTLDNLRHFSLPRIEADVRHAIAKNASCIYMMDPTFNHPRARCMTVCRLLAEVNENRIMDFHAEGRAEIVDEPLADAFVSAGLKSLEIGLQSSNRETLMLMQRGLGASHFLNGCRLLFDRGIEAEIGVIIGLPGDTEESIRTTVDFVIQNELGKLNIYQLQVLPGSEYYRMARDFGLEFDPDPPYYVRGTKTLSEQRIYALVSELECVAETANAVYLRDLKHRKVA